MAGLPGYAAERLRGRRALRSLAVVAAWTLGGLLPSIAGAAWNQAGAGSLNADPAFDASGPAIANIGGAPYVAWRETNGTVYQVHVSRLVEGRWTAVGGTLNLDPTKSAGRPSIASIDGVPYVAWPEPNGTGQQIRVARFTEGAWSAVGGSLNVDPAKTANNPRITSIDGMPWVTWSEVSGTGSWLIRAARLTASGWSAVGGALNFDPSHPADNPSVTSIGGVPYVAWSESNGAKNQIRVAQYTGGGWSPVGGSLNVDPSRTAYYPSITDIDGVPYVGWQEENASSVWQVRVARFTAGAWSALGGSLNVDPAKSAYSPIVIGIGGEPYVVWDESGVAATEVRVDRFTGSAWSGVGGALNVDPARSAYGPSIVPIGPTPWVAWYETNGTAYQVRVARLQWTLTVARGGSGEGSVTSSPAGIVCGTSCSSPFDSGTAVTLSAAPGAGSRFAGWSGGECSGTGACTVTTSGDRAVTAAFESNQPPESHQPPVLWGLAVSPRKFVLAGRLVKGRCVAVTRANRRRRSCTRQVALRVSYRLTLAARVTFTVEQRVAGRLVKGRCVAPTRKNRRQRSCTRLIALRGSLILNGVPGTNGFTFKGKLAGRKLGPGAYRLTARPSAGGKTGKSQSISFQIKR